MDHKEKCGLTPQNNGRFCSQGGINSISLTELLLLMLLFPLLQWGVLAYLGSRRLTFRMPQDRREGRPPFSVVLPRQQLCQGEEIISSILALKLHLRLSDTQSFDKIK